MKDINSLSHSKLRCRYHIAFAPKYRRQEVYGKIKADTGNTLRSCDNVSKHRFYSFSRENLIWSSHTPLTSRQRLDNPSGIKFSFSITRMLFLLRGIT